MHISYIGNFEPPHSTENDMASAMRRNGHTVDTYQEQSVDWSTLPSQIADSDAGMLLWTRTGSLDKHDRELQTSSLRAIRDSVPVAGFHLDLFWGLQLKSDRERWVRELPYFQETDVMFTADGGNNDLWAAANVEHVWLPPGVAGKNCDAVGNVNAAFRAQIGFVGSWRDYHREWPHRKQLVSWVNNNYARQFKYWEGHVRGQDLADLYATVPVLIGDSCMLGSHYWSDRIPETLGRGGFLLHPDTEGLRDHFPEGTLVTWPLGDFKELRYLIDYYLKHIEERETIAAAGRQHVSKHHTYERRVEQIIEYLPV